MAREYILTSESVSEGHPDKVADRISDSILDAYLSRDAEARVACETLVTTNLVVLAGEVRSTAKLSEGEIDRIVRDAIRDIGYIEDDGRFCADTVEVQIRLHEQAGEIARAVDKADRRAQGAGDQGMMFGYASDETPELMPAPITWAHDLLRRLAGLRHSGAVAWLRPDAKSQVSVRYVDGEPKEITGLVLSTQHSPDVSAATIREFVLDELVPQTLPEDRLPADWKNRAWVNPSGSFVEGGPATDTGLTGRKIIVDTYGGAARHGGGAFSGKDPSKVDRSAAYAARWAAKNVVAAGLARRCEVCLAYAIGVAEPVAVYVDTFGTGQRPDDEIARALRKVVDFRPRALIERLALANPIYKPTAAYGHFGREPSTAWVCGRDVVLFPWEQTDLVVPLQRELGI